jgi:enamine deaminase RidA (YjgF/YER057c/UK114 family)
MTSRTPANPSADEPRAGLKTLLPAGWPRPKGYSYGVLAEGRTVFVGGLIGWDENGVFPADFVGQVRQTFLNVAAVLAEAGASPAHLVRLTWYVVDMDEYAGALREVGRVYREVMGANYPPMALVQVVRLVEAAARVEVEATAVIPA